MVSLWHLCSCLSPLLDCVLLGLVPSGALDSACTPQMLGSPCLTNIILQRVRDSLLPHPGGRAFLRVVITAQSRAENVVKLAVGVAGEKSRGEAGEAGGDNPEPWTAAGGWVVSDWSPGGLVVRLPLGSWAAWGLPLCRELPQ